MQKGTPREEKQMQTSWVGVRQACSRSSGHIPTLRQQAQHVRVDGAEDVEEQVPDEVCAAVPAWVCPPPDL